MEQRKSAASRVSLEKRAIRGKRRAWKEEVGARSSLPRNGSTVTRLTKEFPYQESTSSFTRGSSQTGQGYIGMGSLFLSSD